jgi:hypothetical protein
MLKVQQAKPNPAGKDRIRTLATPEQQLAGEWIDIQNVHHNALNLNGLQIYHTAYKLSGSEWEIVYEFNFQNFALPANTTLRLHSGGHLDINRLLPVDREGADYHAFTGKNYVWNNTKRDDPLIWNPTMKEKIDQAYYEPPVPDGKILKRYQNQLI